jgi:tight adherence protein C
MMVYLLLWIAAFIFFTLCCFGLLYVLNFEKFILYRRVGPYFERDQNVEHSRTDEQIDTSLYERMLAPNILRLRQFVLGKMSKSKMTELTKKVNEAGNPFGMNAVDFRIAQLIVTVVLFFVGIILFVPNTDQKLKAYLMAVIFGLIGYSYANFYLGAKRKNRIKQIEKDMPDFFDLVNVSIEAGLGFDSAVKRVCTQMDTPLSQEFLNALEDMKLGKSRRQAFIELRERVPSPFFKSIMNSIIQADTMGLGLSKVLRTQAQRTREKQRQTVKEAAMKAPIKMMFPLVLFIFPTLFIVLLGPVIVNLVTRWL